MISDDEHYKRLIKELQEKIERDEENRYSPKVIKEYRNPTNFGCIDNPDATGQIKGPCGDTMKISLKITKNVIQNARFWTDGCGATLACGNMLTSVILGKNILEVLDISSEHLILMLDGLPQENHHCATLAISTLHQSLKKYYTRTVNQDTGKKDIYLPNQEEELENGER